MRPAGWARHRTGARAHRGNQGPGVALAGLANSPIQKGNVAAHKGLFWLTRLNEINQLMLTNP
jgi:hypothetical protein